MNRESRGRGAVIGAVALVAITCTFWYVKMWSDRPAMTHHEARDLFSGYLPNLLHYTDTLAEGRVPLWSPYEFTGGPFLALLEFGPFYPLTALYFIRPIETAHLVSVLVHLMLAGSFTFLFCRVSLRVSAPAALIGALALTLSGWMATRVLYLPDQSRSAVYIPLIFLFCDRLIARPNGVWCAALAAAFALQFLAGEAEIAVRTGILVTLYVMYRLVQNDSGGRGRTPFGGRGVALFGTAVVLSLAISAVQLVPTAEATLQSVRAPGGMTYEQVTSPIDGGIEDPATLLQAILGGGDGPSLFYIGVLPALLAIYTVTRPQRQTWFFSAAAVIIFGLLLGDGTPLYRLYHALPTGDWFRYPMRFQPFLVFTVSALAAMGADRVFRDAGALRTDARAKWSLIAFFGVAIGGLLAWDLRSGGLDMSAALIAVGILAAYAVSGSLWPAPAARLKWLPGGVVVAALLAAPFMFYSLRPYNVPNRVDFHGLPPRMLDYLREHIEPGERVYVDYALWDGRHVPKIGVLTGIPAINGFSPFVTEDFWRLVRPYRLARLNEVPVEDEITLGLPGGLSYSANATELLQVLGARYVVLGLGSEFHPDPARPGYSSVPPGYESVLEIDRLSLLRVPEALPRAFLARKIPASIEELVDESRNIVPASITHYSENRVVIESEGGGMLILTDQYFPGWRVQVNGEPGDIWPALGAFRGVELPPGQFRVEFRYAPGTFTWGARISLAAVAVSSMLLFVALRRRPQGESP